MESLYIGRHSNDDVVYQGHPTLQYNPLFFTAFEQARTKSASFKATSSIPLQVTQVSVKAHNSTCSPFFSVDEKNIIDKDGWTLLITFNCSKEGNSDIFVDLEVESHVIQFAFKKRYGSERLGFNVGSSIEHNYGSNDVVDNGRSTLMWHPDSHSAFFLSWILEKSFYITLNDEHATKQKVLSLKPYSSSNACDPYIVDDLPKDRILHNNVTNTFTLYFNCTKPTKDVINVTIHLEHFPPITICMTKILGGLRKYFDVGTKPEGADVVYDGIATPSWLIDDPLNNAVVDGRHNTTAFYLTMSSDKQNQTYSPPVMYYSSSKEGVVKPKISGPANKGGEAYHGGSMRDNHFLVTYNCQGLGYANISVFINVYPYDYVKYRWKKVCSTERLGMHIGTLPGFDNVASNGIAALAWGIDSHVHFEKEIVRETTFYVTLEGSQKISNINVTAESGCRPYLETTIKPGDIIQDSTEFTVVYSCSELGRHTITVWLELDGVFKPIGFRWTKRVGGVRHGLSISTEHEESNVVSNGIPQLPWDVLLHSVEIPEEESNTSFSFTINEDECIDYNQTIHNVMFHSSSKYLVVIPDGDLKYGGSVKVGECKSLSARYVCLAGTKQQRSSANVTAELELAAYDTLYFGWKKHCYPSLRGLTVGTSPGLTDVVYDGITNPKWSFDDHPTIIDKKTLVLTFYVSLDGYTEIEQELSDIIVLQTSVENIYLCSPVLSGSLAETKKITTTPQDLIITFNCTDPGTSNFTLILHIEENYGSTAFGWSKLVGGPRDGLNIDSDYGKGIPVVRNGITEHKWRYENSMSVMSIGDSVGSTSFDLYMAKNNQFPYQPYSSMVISVRPEMSCHYYFLGDIEGGTITMNVTTLTVVYNCFEEEEVFFKISFDVSPYDPIVFAWHKESSGEDLAFNLATSSGTEVVHRGRVIAKDHVYFESKNLTLDAYLSEDYASFNINSSFNDIGLDISNSLCKINISGNGANGGMITKDNNLTIHLNAEDCKVLQDVNIVLSYNLTPFKSINVKLVVPATVPENSFPVAIVVSIAGSLVLVAVVIGIVVHLQLKKWRAQPEPRYMNVNVNEVCIKYFVY